MENRYLGVFALLVALAACGGADEGQPTRDEAPSVTTSGPAATGDRPEQPGASELSAAPADAPAVSEPTDGGALPAGPSSAPTGNVGPAEVAPFAPPAGPALASAASDAHAILERAERAYAQVRSMEADFVQEVFVPLLDSSVHSRGRIFHRQPDRFLMRFSDPEGDVIVADGRYILMYHPSTDDRQAMRTPLAQGGQQVDLHREFLSDAGQRYSATLSGSEAVGGRSAHTLTLVPRGASSYQRIRIWVDRDDHLVRRFEIVEENGSVRKLEMRNLRTNVSLPDELFQYTLPPGVQIYEP